MKLRILWSAEWLLSYATILGTLLTSYGLSKIIHMDLPLFVLPALLALHYASYVRDMVKLPFGPPPLPFSAHGKMLDINYPERYFMRLKDLYGDVFTVSLPSPVVVVASYEAMQEFFISHASSTQGRSHSFVFTYFTKDRVDGDGLILAQGHKWEFMRPLVHKYLSRHGIYGDGGTLQAEILNQCAVLEHQMYALATGNNLVSIDETIGAAIANVIQEITIGTKFDFTDPEFVEQRKNIRSIVKAVLNTSMILLNWFPFLRYIYSFPAFEAFERNGYAVQRWFRKHYDEHKETRTDGNPRDFMDFFLEKMETDETGIMKELSCLLTCGDLWTGGMETSTTTMLWGIIHLVRHPEVQEKVHKELVEVFGSSTPDIGRRKETPYFHAVLDEIQRLSNVLPLAIPHTATKEFRVRNCTVPAGTEIFPALTCILLDEKIFPDPFAFNPGRFLDEEGQYRPNRFLIPFGMGPRKCIGQKVAETELYLFFTHLLQNFRFYVEENDVLPPLVRSSGGITSPPEPYNVRIEFRDIRKI